MTLNRRIVVAGLPTAGLTVFAALALSGASATAATGALAAHPVVKMTPCADEARVQCGGYGTTTPPTGTAPATTPPTTPATTPATTPVTTTVTTPATTPVTTPTLVAPTTGTTPTGTAPATTVPGTTPPGTSPVSAAAVPSRGGPPYGSTGPTGGTDTVPASASPSSVSPAHVPNTTATTPGGVSAGHALPVTGAPMGSMVSFGGLLVAAGAASMWLTRRRRTA